MKLIDKFDFSIFSIPKLRLHFRYIIPLLFGTKTFEIQIDGLKLLLRPRTFDLYIVAEIFLENSYLIPQLKDKPIKTVIDLEANIGIFSVWVSKKYSPKKVISVEMDKDNIKQLGLNINTNSGVLKSDFTLINKAIFLSKTTLSYEKVPINRGMHTLNENNSGKNHVETITLAEVIEENDLGIVDLLKIDIEGSEKYLLNPENESVFSEKIKYLTMEVHVSNNFPISSVQEYFTKIGLRCTVFKHWSSINYLFYAENLNIGA